MPKQVSEAAESMTSSPLESNATASISIRWVLRATIAIQAIGIAAQFLLTEFETESPLFGYLLYERGWSQVTAQRVDDFGSWLWMVAGLAVLFVPLVCRCFASKRIASVAVWLERLLLVVLFAVQAILVAATWHRGTGEAFNSLIPLEHCARWMTPVLLLLLLPSDGKTISTRRLVTTMWLMRLTVAIAFAAHGYKAIEGYGPFLDYLLSAANGLLGWDASEATMTIVLTIIGWVDLLVAILLLTTHWRTVALYMMLWALIGAGARVIHSGLPSTFEVAIRSGNYCLPLAVLLYFHYRHFRYGRDARVPSVPQAPDSTP